MVPCGPYTRCRYVIWQVCLLLYTRIESQMTDLLSRADAVSLHICEAKPKVLIRNDCAELIVEVAHSVFEARE